MNDNIKATGKDEVCKQDVSSYRNDLTYVYSHKLYRLNAMLFGRLTM